MNSIFLVLGSYTQAIKARNILTNYGIAAKVEKINTQNGGCGFGVRFYGNSEKAVALLTKYGITIRKEIN